MRLEEILAKLVQLKSAHGDLDIVVVDNDSTVWDVQGVEFNTEVSNDDGVFEKLIVIET